MYRYKRAINAASDDTDTRFDDGMKLLNDDVDYLTDTFDKMNRDGNKEKAIALLSSFHDYVNKMISDAVSEVSA